MAGHHFKVLLIILPVLNSVLSLIVHSHFRDSFSRFTGLSFSLPVTNNTSFYVVLAPEHLQHFRLFSKRLDDSLWLAEAHFEQTHFTLKKQPSNTFFYQTLIVLNYTYKGNLL